MINRRAEQRDLMLPRQPETAVWRGYGTPLNYIKTIVFVLISPISHMKKDEHFIF